MSKTNEEKLAIKEAREAAKEAKQANKKKKQAEKQAKQQEARQKVLEALGDAKDIVNDKAGDAVDVMKKAGAFAVQKASEASLDIQKQVLNPVFADELRLSTMPDMIRICSPDKQHLDSPACKDSVGYMMTVKDLKVLNLYTAYKDEYGLDFYPVPREDVYYRHPFIPNRYVSLNSYFHQIKKEKVDELEKIAFALGAKYVKITLYTQRKSFTGVKGGADLSVGGKTNKKKKKPEIAVSAVFDNESYEELGVESETKMKGHVPESPKLQYFSNDSDIAALIEMRLTGNNEIYEKSYKIKYSNSSKISAASALKIDAALKKMKLIDTNATISGQVEEESRLVYDYLVKFPKKSTK